MSDRNDDDIRNLARHRQARRARTLANLEERHQRLRAVREGTDDEPDDEDATVTPSDEFAARLRGKLNAQRRPPLFDGPDDAA